MSSVEPSKWLPITLSLITLSLITLNLTNRLSTCYTAHTSTVIATILTVQVLTITPYSINSNKSKLTKTGFRLSQIPSAHLAQLNKLKLNEHLWTQTLNTKYHNPLISCTELSQIPVRSTVKSYSTSYLNVLWTDKQYLHQNRIIREAIPNINDTDRERIFSCIIVKCVFK